MVSRYLVSIVVTCRPRTLSTRDINIEVPPELYSNHHATEKRPYQYNKLLQEKSLSLFLHLFILSLPRYNSVYDKVPRSYPSRLFLEIWYHLTGSGSIGQKGDFILHATPDLFDSVKIR